MIHSLGYGNNIHFEDLIPDKEVFDAQLLLFTYLFLKKDNMQ
jgi:hypothetical protein